MNAFELNWPTIDYNELRDRCFWRELEAFPALRRSNLQDDLAIPSGLVVCDNGRIRGSLGEVLLLCGVAPILTDSLALAARHIVAGELSLVICQDFLGNGSYTDLLDVQNAVGHSAPLIVVSQTGDWPEYMEAINRGAYDFLRYPLIPGELQRIIRNLLKDSREQVSHSVD